MPSSFVALFALLLLSTSGAAGSGKSATPQRPSAIGDCSAISARDHNLAPLSSVCEFAKEADRILPNFTCEQMTQRYFPAAPAVSSEIRPGASKPIVIYRDAEERQPDDLVADVVTATVTYENGIDRYANVRIADRPAQHELLDLIGPITTGDFGSELLSIFREENAARFTFRAIESTPEGQEFLFDFGVSSGTNHLFTLREDGFETHPNIEGTLWIGVETNEVRRLDVVAKNVDPSFSTDHIRFSTVFQKVSFGDAGKFLLPTQSESIVCDRRHLCRHNVTQWANCGRLAVKTKIIF